MKNSSKVHVSAHPSSRAHCNRRGAAPRAPIAAKISSLDAPEKCPHFPARHARMRGLWLSPSLDASDQAPLLFSPHASLKAGCPRTAGCWLPLPAAACAGSRLRRHAAARRSAAQAASQVPQALSNHRSRSRRYLRLSLLNT